MRDFTLEWAIRLCGTTIAWSSVCLLHVLEQRFVPRSGVGGAAFLEVGDELRRLGDKALHEEMGERPGAVVLAEGNVWQQIDRVARERGSSLIVVGTHGRSGLEHVLIESVAEKVTRLCTVPVLTVR